MRTWMFNVVGMLAAIALFAAGPSGAAAQYPPDDYDVEELHVEQLDVEELETGDEWYERYAGEWRDPADWFEGYEYDYDNTWADYPGGYYDEFGDDNWFYDSYDDFYADEWRSVYDESYDLDPYDWEDEADYYDDWFYSDYDDWYYDDYSEPFDYYYHDFFD